MSSQPQAGHKQPITDDRQFSDPAAETLSISDVARLLLEAGAQNRPDDLVEIRDLLEQSTEALLTR